MNHLIKLAKAIEMTTKYRAEKETILAASHRDQNILPIAESFERSAFDTVLAQPGCTGLRVYYGMDDELKVHAIIVGTNAQGEDILPATDATANRDGDEDEDPIIEEGNRCPPFCALSPLNP